MAQQVVRASGSRDAKLADVARTQLGLITYAQVRTAGFSSPAICRAVRSGRLHRLHRGVDAVGHLNLAPFARELAALLAIGSGAVLSRHSATALWDMAPALPAAVDVCVRGSVRATRAGLRIHVTSRLDAADVTTKQGLPVTRPARTLIDVAGSESPRRFNWIVEQARSRRLVSDTSLRETIGRAPSGHGPAVVRAHLRQSPTRPSRSVENADCSSYCGRLVCPSQESTRASRGGRLTSGGLRNASPSSSTAGTGIAPEMRSSGTVPSSRSWPPWESNSPGRRVGD